MAKILLVESDNAIATIIFNWLKKNKHEIIKCSSIEAALDIYKINRKFPFEIIIANLSLAEKEHHIHLKNYNNSGIHLFQAIEETNYKEIYKNISLADNKLIMIGKKIVSLAVKSFFFKRIYTRYILIANPLKKLIHPGKMYKKTIKVNMGSDLLGQITTAILKSEKKYWNEKYLLTNIGFLLGPGFLTLAFIYKIFRRMDYFPIFNIILVLILCLILFYLCCIRILLPMYQIGKKRGGK